MSVAEGGASHTKLTEDQTAWLENPKLHPFNKSEFKQQRMPMWMCKMRSSTVVITLTLAFFVFSGLGTVQLLWNNNIVEVTVRYDNLPDCSNKPKRTCQVPIKIPRQMPPPVFLYYKISNFYSNHRNFVQDRQPSQMYKNASTESTYSKCEIAKKFEGKYYSAAAEFEKAGKPATPFLYPCGLVAQSYFTDSFPKAQLKSSKKTLEGDSWSNKDITWAWDREKKFKPRKVNQDETNLNIYRKFTMPPVDDENFIVWMKTSSLPTSYKLNRKILDIELQEQETLEVTVEANSAGFWPSHEWGGHKYLVLTTMSSFGGKNMTLGVIFALLGAVCLVMAGAVTYKVKK